MGLLYGRAGRLNTKNTVFRPGQHDHHMRIMDREFQNSLSVVCDSVGTASTCAAPPCVDQLGNPEACVGINPIVTLENSY